MIDFKPDLSINSSTVKQTILNEYKSHFQTGNRPIYIYTELKSSLYILGNIVDIDGDFNFKLTIPATNWEEEWEDIVHTVVLARTACIDHKKSDTNKVKESFEIDIKHVAEINNNIRTSRINIRLIDENYYEIWITRDYSENPQWKGIISGKVV